MSLLSDVRNRMSHWFKGGKAAAQEAEKVALFGGGTFPGSSGTVVANMVASGNATSATNGFVLGQTAYSGTVLDVVGVKPTDELVSANGAWAGIGAFNQMVLSPGVNQSGERFDPTVVEAMLDDSAVNAAIATLKMTVLCGELRFQPSVTESADGVSDPTKGDPVEAKWAADYCDRAFRNLDVPFHVWAWDFLDFLVYGSKVAEIVLQEQFDGPDRGLYYLARLKIKARWSYHLCTDPFYNLVSIYAQTAWGPAYIDKRHFLVGSLGARDADPRGTSVLRGAKEAWRLKLRAMRSRAKGDDQFGTPSIWMMMSEGSMIESQATNPATGKPWTNVEYCQWVLNQWQNGGSLATPNGSQLKVMESSRDGKQLADSVDYHDRSIVRAILLTAKGMLEPEHYTQGGGEHAKEQQRGLADHIRELLMGLVKEQVCRYLLTESRGAAYAKLYTPTPMMGQMWVDNFLQYASALGVILQSGGWTMSQWTWLLAQANIPLPKPDELRIGPNGLIPDEVPATPEPKVPGDKAPEKDKVAA